MNKRLRLFLLLSGLLFTSIHPVSADGPAKKEQITPAPAPTNPTEEPSPASEVHDFPFHTEHSSPASQSQSPSYEGAFIKMIVTVVVLILFVFLTFWVVRRLGQGRLRGFGSNLSIQVIERKPLSPKSMLYLVQVGHQKFLIAESQLEVRKLGPIGELSEAAADETS